MFYKHSVLEVNGQEVLYLYLSPTYEFAQDFYGTDRKKSIYERVTNYIRNRGVRFNGNKVYLVVNGIIVSSLTLTPMVRNGKQNVDDMLPFSQYVEIIRDFIPKDEKIEFLETNEDLPIKAGKFISMKYSSGILKRFLLEDYAFGVVSSEMPIDFLLEARKAQAVLARTYALKQESLQQVIKEQNKTQIYTSQENLKSLWKDQYDTFAKEIRSAVLETEGEYLTYLGQPIEVYTHIVNHGKTENAKDFLFQSIPYLVSVDSPWDMKEFPYTSSMHFTYPDISKLLHQKITSKSKVSISRRTEGGRVMQLEIGPYRYRADYLYRLLGLKSTDFSVRTTEDGITFTFLALEHGLGMSKYGANGMAKMGYNYRQILAHYFPNTEIKKLSD